MLDQPTFSHSPCENELLTSLYSPRGQYENTSHTTSFLKNLSRRSCFFSSGSISANLQLNMNNQHNFGGM